MNDKIIINKDDSGKRIDKFLKEGIFFNDERMTRGEIIRNIKTGNITVNGEKVKPSHGLKEEDNIRINISDKSGKLIANRKIKFVLMYEDENILIINKPAGLQVHPSSKQEADTLVAGLIAKFPDIKNVGDDPDNRPGIVHRLDKDTSGVMVIARNQAVYDVLKKKFIDREIIKKYLAIVEGKMKKGTSGIINKEIARATNYKKQVIAGRKTRTKVRTAVTEYIVLDSSGEHSLVGVLPKTGRMHQIRLHLASIGHPVFGDTKYGAKNKDSTGAKKHMLHAECLNFELYGKKYSFRVIPPGDFLQELTNLDLKSIKS